FSKKSDIWSKPILKQNPDENRNLEETMARAWAILSTLPEGELTKIKDKHVKQYHKKADK
ncbi:MAG TPA: V-type ATP synthase subunit B, partial [Nitrososphaeraceae archaeon]|nr:V-type ATP synthase subunit B [Nitrososphaeraceae archaeon]